MSPNSNKMKSLITLSIVGFLLFTNFVCQPIDVRKSMVHFDQAFLPVLMHTYKGDMHQAKRAVFYLEFQWQKLRNQHEFIRPEPEWQDAFRRIDEWLGDAYTAIDANDAKLAMAQLEHVRYEFMELRERFRINYYLDYLYDFQASAELLTETAGDEMLCLMAWEELEQMAMDANAAWRDVQYQPVDAVLYELDAEKLARLDDHMQRVTGLMKNLNAAIETADRAEVAQACKKLEPAFTEVLWVFGNINASTTYYAERKADNININAIIR